MKESEGDTLRDKLSPGAGLCPRKLLQSVNKRFAFLYFGFHRMEDTGQGPSELGSLAASFNVQ